MTRLSTVALLTGLLALSLRPLGAQPTSPPVISDIAEQAVYPGATTPAIPFTVNDGETPAAALTVSAVSSNTSLILVTGIVIGGSGSNRTVTLTPAAGQRGTSLITLNTDDGEGGSASTKFLLRVEEFTDVQLVPAGVSVSFVAWGDSDADGDLDALVCGSTNFQSNTYFFTQVYQNTGSNRFVNLTADLPRLAYAAAAWGDYDNDGDLDLVVSGFRYDEYSTEVHRNDGDGVFTRVAVLPGVSDGTAAWADVDNDGDLDLVLSGLRPSGFPDVTWIYRNDGGGQFTEAQSGLPSAWAYASIDWDDFDHDGDADLLQAGGGKTGVFRNDGPAVFVDVAAGLPGVLYGVSRWGDFDGDGLSDILVSGDSTAISGSQTEVSRIYRNLGNGAFSNINAQLVPINFAGGTWGDFDSDGDLDVMIGGTPEFYYVSPLTRLYRNDGNQSFSLVLSNLPIINPRSMVSGDYDNDGDVDALLSGRVFRNNINRSNTPPSAPSALAATLLPNQEMRLTWSQAMDAETTNADGLSYNLRVGTTPGGVQIVSPQSHPLTGQRFLPQRGNGSSGRSWRLANLAHGTYYWSVQAVDPGLAASAFSAEGVFTVTNSPPTVSDIPNQSVLPGQVPPPITVVVNDAETPPDNLAVTVHSSNTNLVRAGDLLISGSGTERTLTFTPQQDQHGVTTITVTVTDTDGRSASDDFTFSFEEFTPSYTGTVSPRSSIQFADFDSDGRLDLLYGQAGNAPLFRNKGGGSFENSFIIFPCYFCYYQWTAWGDYDNDGYADVIYDGQLNRNVGGTSFSKVTTGLETTRLAHWAFGDFDNDGRVDIACTGENINSFIFSAIYRNTGGGAFSNILAGIVGGNGIVEWADMDNDGDLDLTVSAGLTRLYRNNGNGTFTDLASAFRNVSGTGLAWGDFDNDGDLDLLITGGVAANTYATRIYRNEGGNVFAELDAALPGVTGSFATAAWGDYDNDGWLDAFLGQLGAETNVFRIFRNGGNGTLADIGANLFGASAFGDYDNDGDLDLAGGASVLFRNNVAVPNTPPNSPTSLSTTTVLTSVRFSWARATDLNQTGGHTYNLRVGRSPGAADVFSPLADLTTGQRRVVALGNAGTGTNWFLTNLAVGTYYWSVQAIDHSYDGSAWAPERTFTIPDQPPVVLTDGATGINFGGATLNGRVNPSAFPAAFRFEFGETTNYGSATAWQSAGNGSAFTPVSVAINGLAAGATYHYRIVATNGQGATLGLDRLFTTRVFTDVSAVLASFSQPAGAWGDYDNDGDLDLLMIGSTSGLRLHRNDGGGSFSDGGVNLTGAADGAVAWGDYDNDGWLDFVIAGATNSSTASTRLYRNLRNGMFTNSGMFFPGLAQPALAWGDFDNDGDLDLLLTGLIGTSTYFADVYRNDRNGMFRSIGASITGISDGAVAWGDYDNDGDLDILLSGRPGYSSAYGFAAVYRNNGDATFSPAGPNLPQLYASSVAWGDFNNDGSLDLLITGWANGASYSATTAVYRNNGNGTFAAITTSLPNAYAGSVSWGDFNNDGFLDLLMSGSFSGSGTSPAVFRGFGDGTFLDIGVGMPAGNLISSGWADYDNDGDLDYLMLGASVISKNLIATPNTPPLQPANLSATVLPANDVLLTWSAGSDGQTVDPRGLTYSLRVGTTPGGVDVASPPAELLTGFRRVSARGEIQTTGARLRGLPRGTYYWSVQTVDGGWAGSAFAPEGSFVVTNGPPVISFIADQSMAPGDPPLAVNFVVTDGETPPDQLFYTATSSRTSLVQNANSILSGSGTNRTLTLSPEPNATGSATITITVLDEGGLRAGQSFQLLVQNFTPMGRVLSDFSSISVAEWGDFDGDGLLDLAASGRAKNAEAMAVYHNDGGLIFTEIPAGLPTGLSGSLAWSDTDNDNDLDLLAISGGLWRLQRNNVNGTFTSLTTGPSVPTVGSIVAGDIDNDGDVDALLRTTVMQNVGNGQFAPMPALTSGLPATASIRLSLLADVDGDGDLDALITGSTNNAPSFTHLYRNNGHGAFTLANSGLPGLENATAAFGDADNDGDLDLLLTGVGRLSPSVLTNRALLLKNDGVGGFTQVATTLAPLSGGVVAWGDYNGDGWLDVFLAGVTYPFATSYGMARIYRNNGDGTFTDIEAGLPNAAFTFAAWGDGDGDGDLDLLIGGSGIVGDQANAQLYRNNGHFLRAPPPVPTGLTAMVSDRDAVLTWNFGTNSAGFTANLRVGTTPGGTQIISPVASPATGQRRFAHPGPALARWKLNNLAPGRYHWSVQSVDGTFTASPFAAETQFIVDAAWLTDAHLSAGNFEFNLHGVVGQSYTIEVSTDLRTWTPWQTVPLTSSAVAVSAPAFASGPRFYRARLPAP